MRPLLARAAAAMMFALTPAMAAAPAETAAPMNAVGVHTIDIKLFSFQPKEIDVAAGTPIRWTNQDGIEHSITHGSPEAPGAAFDSGFIRKGQGFTATFGEAGEFPYFCARHPSMRGKVSVRSKRP